MPTNPPRLGIWILTPRTQPISELGHSLLGRHWRQVRPRYAAESRSQFRAFYVKNSSTPLIERNPLLFWKTTTVMLALAVIVLLAIQHGMHR